MNPVGRLALRHEGKWWKAYWAKPDSMEDALLLATIQVRFVEDPVRKSIFIGLMREALADMIEETTGQRPTWPEPEGEPGPEHERSGHG